MQLSEKLQKGAYLKKRSVLGFVLFFFFGRGYVDINQKKNQYYYFNITGF